MSPKLSTKHRLKVIKRVLSGEKKTKICREEGISRPLLYKWLKRYKKEKKFCSLHPQGKAYKSFKKHPKLSIKDRHFMIDRVLGGESVSRVCRLYDVSRTTFYRWQKRYDEAKSGQKLESLWDKRPQAEKYFNQSPLEYEKAVLAAVIEYPELSSHRLVYTLPAIGKKPILTNHGVQNILRRNNLSTFDKRLAYSESLRKTAVLSGFIALIKKVISQIGEQETPVRQIVVRASFTIFLAIFTSTIFYGGTSLWRLVFGPTGVVLTTGLMFSLLSLFLGMVFFIYSLKYYFTVAVVLSFSKENDGKESLKEQGKNILERIFFMGSQRKNYQRKTFSANSNWKGGLNPDLSKIRLRRQPFVSIHIAIYNEKRVINRLLTAATSIDYDNYEVIIVDDSKDETRDILKQWKNHPRVKIILRETREGYKGGALKEALNITDPRAEFVCVFDADFIPYPDTITQFLKYFQSSASSLDKRVLRKTNIACIQGYQWHVLNKSENWITRGVRSEYAGSYVIERSGEEIYSGLKQISGSVYMIRKDVLQNIGWGTSITEDFQLTLKLYEQGYKVVYTPYIQAPAEAVSTIKRLIRQRMRWAEGHSHNVRNMFTRLLWGKWQNRQTTDYRLRKCCRQKTVDRGNWTPSPLTLSEKLEFLYLAPYYLQSFLFMLGTFAWFVAEVIFRVQLPFWTEVWGWSLVFTNLFALPLMNMVGLFLEEAEEKDYLGLFSFVALSYIVAPFQGYAALKGFISKEEGPWFRTPKTGVITDIFTPGKFYRRIFGILAKPSEKMAAWPHGSNSYINHSTIQPLNHSYLSLATANNSFNSIVRPKRKKMKFVPRMVIAVFLTITIMLNYLTFFLPKAQAATVSLEQQINIIDQLYSNTSTSTAGVPTDNSLGLVRWTSGSYSGTVTVYFEAVICNTGHSDGGKPPTQLADTTYAGLYNSSGTLVTGSQVTYSDNSCTYSRKRSGSITLTDGTDYTVRIYSSNSGGTARIKAARIIITQTNATWITDTETQVEVGNNEVFTNASYATLTDHKIYRYNADLFSPAPTITFEATLRQADGASGTTCNAQLYNKTDSAAVSSSEVTSNVQAATRVRSGSITLDGTNDDDYVVQVYRSAGTSQCQIKNAKIILTQSDTSNGITAVEMVHHQLNTYTTTSSSSYLDVDFPNQYSPGNFSAGTFVYYFETTMKMQTGSPGTYAKLENDTDSNEIDDDAGCSGNGNPTSEISTTSTSYARIISAELSTACDWPSANKELDTRIKEGSSYTSQYASSWLLIQVSALQVPENLLFFIPVVFFLPKIIKKIKTLRKREILVAELRET